MLAELSKRYARNALVGLAAVAILATIASAGVAAPDRTTAPSKVEVVNAPDNAVPVIATPAGQSVVGARTVTVQPGESGFLPLVLLLEIPEGKRFHAEQANGELLASDTGVVRLQLLATSRSGSNVPALRVPVSPSFGEEGPDLGSPSTLRRALFNEEMRFVVDGPGEVLAAIFRSDPASTNPASQNVTILGRLVDCSSCVARQ